MEDKVKEIRTATITSKGQICIPNIARNLAGFKEGTKVNILIYPDRVELRPMEEERNEALMCMLASEEALAKNWLSKEDEEAWKDL